MFYRKQYEAIARTIREATEPRESPEITAAVSDSGRFIAETLADMFAADNPRIDRPRFLAACKTGETA